VHTEIILGDIEKDTREGDLKRYFNHRDARLQLTI
jgi:hypothetical protein